MRNVNSPRYVNVPDEITVRTTDGPQTFLGRTRGFEFLAQVFGRAFVRRQTIAAF